jgi:hypothetical protein
MPTPALSSVEQVIDKLATPAILESAVQFQFGMQLQLLRSQDRVAASGDSSASAAPPRFREVQHAVSHWPTIHFPNNTTRLAPRPTN